jgi:NAD(P)-dependent dehydrogenase (short-subunit alcohol dehydrogenase family)
MTKTATVVTGGSAGIGHAICRQLLDQGETVINLDRNAGPERHANLVNIQVDLADAAATRDVASRLAAEYSVTRTVNNAGTNRLALAQDVTLEDLDHVVALHLKTPLILMQAFLPAMQAAGFGRIVNIATRAVLGRTHRSVYAATKSGMIGYTRTWALELGRHGITVNTVAPGPIATELFDASNPPGSATRENLVNMLAVKRVGTPDDLARAVLFFLSPDNGFITGQTLYVCGGSSLGAVPL